MIGLTNLKFAGGRTWLHFDAEVEQLEGAVLDGGELRIEDEARLRGAVHGHDIAGHGGEVSQEGAEAVDRQAVVGAAVAGLALGGRGALRLGDDGGPCGVGSALS